MIYVSTDDAVLFTAENVATARATSSSFFLSYFLSFFSSAAVTKHRGKTKTVMYSSPRKATHHMGDFIAYPLGTVSASPFASLYACARAEGSAIHEEVRGIFTTYFAVSIKLQSWQKQFSPS